VQRGNRRLDVFFTDEDRIAYIEYLKAACKRYDVAIWAYCLMSNHVHFIAVPGKADSLSRCFSDTHGRYTRRINARQGWKGHLWQARFGSNVLSEKHLIAAVRYVERNPVRAGIVKEAWEYPWSSAAYHTSKVNHDRLAGSDNMLKDLIGDWEVYLREQDEKVFVEMIRQESFVSRPMGDDPFVEELEKQLNRHLRRGKAGRPVRKDKQSAADPNDETLKTFRDSEAGRGLVECKDTDDMFRKLDVK
jgi:putative transposase